MKSIVTSCALMLFFACGMILPAYAQKLPSADTILPVPKPVNAGFDVIIKKNGDIVYGLVKEVGEKSIKYQRTDIPDGPVYIISKDDVYAISYRNQVKDIINPLRDSIVHDTVMMQPPNARDTFMMKRDSSFQSRDTSRHDTTATSAKISDWKKMNFRKDGNLRIGLGFFRSYTKVSQVSQYASSVNFPIINIGYDVRYNDQIRLGVQIAFGPHKFTGQQYSSYDSTQSAVTLKENIFMLDLYGKYNIMYHTAKVQPYIIGGLGIHNSHINSSYNITFINDPNHAVLVNSGTNSVGLGIIARIGAEYYLNKTSRLFGDVGIGPSILNFGVSLNLN